MNPVGFMFGVKLAADDARSALPNAPVVPVRESNPRVRRAAARVLRRMADRVEPIT